MASVLGHLLLESGAITSQDLEAGLQLQQETRGRLASVLVQGGLLSAESARLALGRQLRMPVLRLSAQEIAEEVLDLIPARIAVRHRIVPVARAGSILAVALTDPADVIALDEVKFATGLQIESALALDREMQLILERYYAGPKRRQLEQAYRQLGKVTGEPEVAASAPIATLKLEQFRSDRSEASISRFVNLILADAIQRSASDIHLESYEDKFRIRTRVDGCLATILEPPASLRDAIVSRLKVMARLDISERRLPQDGKIRIRVELGNLQRAVELRVSSLPTVHGERLVLRVLDPSRLPSGLSDLGFDPPSLKRFQQAIEQSFGLVLVTGPTGCGKTSTLYACLQHLNREQVNIVTAEDPVEFNLAGINQLQIKDGIGLTFARALRSFLRQDPDIIMVGEIRDAETAEIALKAALTGHLVMSTLHTTDAPSAVDRLLNMNLEPFLLASCLHVICAQRLVRKTCRNCRRDPEKSLTGLGEREISGPRIGQEKSLSQKGCSECGGTGYLGRIGLFEVLSMTPSLRHLVAQGEPASVLRSRACQEGMLTLRQSGLEKVRAGITTVEEVLRETPSAADLA